LYEIEAREIFAETIIAREGMVIDIPLKKHYNYEE
jgi:hypothetical protein